MSKPIRLIVSLIVVVISIVYLTAYAIPNIFKAQEAVKQANLEVEQSQKEVDEAMNELNQAMEGLNRQ